MSHYQPSEEMQELLIRVADDVLTPEDAETLERLLESDPDSRAFYYEFVNMNALLQWHHAPAIVSTEQEEDAFGMSQHSAKKTVSSPVLGFLADWACQAAAFIAKPTPFSISIALVVTVAAVFAMSWIHLTGDRQRVAVPANKEPAERKVVAWINAAANVKWEKQAVQHTRGDNLTLGARLRLESGLVQITFNSGATTILHGPAEFLLRSEMGGFLIHGTLTAKVPAGAKGFTIGTAAAEIVDLGTEFGVVVDHRQTSTVTVFQGRVSVTQSSHQSNMKRELVAGQSMRFNVLGEALAARASDHVKQFVRVMPPLSYRQTVLADKPRWYWSFDESSGPVIQWVRKRMQGNLDPVGPVRRTTHESLSSGLRLGRAADFTGGGCFAGDLDSDAVSGAWALETWLQVEQSTPGFTKQYIIHTDPKTPRSSNPALIFDFNDGDGVDNELELFSKYNESRGEVRRTAGGPQLSDGRWHHFVFVFYGDGSRGVADRTEVYIDGTRHQGLSRRGFSADLRIGMLLVGAARLSGEQGFKGRLDELAVYDLSSMTALEIEKRMPAMARRHITAARRVNGKALAEPVAPTISTELK